MCGVLVFYPPHNVCPDDEKITEESSLRLSELTGLENAETSYKKPFLILSLYSDIHMND